MDGVIPLTNATHGGNRSAELCRSTVNAERGSGNTTKTLETCAGGLLVSSLPQFIRLQEAIEMRFTRIALYATLLFSVVALALVCFADTPATTVKGYVLDSACAFTKKLDKPISKECAISCANAGSQLVILGEDGMIYWPIADSVPATGQNPKLLQFAGEKVSVTGKVYQRGGSKAIVIEKIVALAAK